MQIRTGMTPEQALDDLNASLTAHGGGEAGGETPAKTVADGAPELALFERYGLVPEPDSGTAQPAAAAAAAAPATPNESERIAALEHRISVLTGKLEKEGPRLSAEIAAKDAEIARLTQELQAAQARQAEITDPVQRYGMSDDEALLDPTVISVAQRIAQTETNFLKAQLAEMQAKLDSAIGSTQEMARETREQGFFRTVDEKIPNWRDVNSDKTFLQWLGTRAPGTGATYGQLLQASQQECNADAAVEVFLLYLDQAKRGGMAAHVTPSPGGAPANGAKTAERTVTRAELSQFMQMRPETTPDYQRLAAFYERAIAEGRVGP